MKSKKLLDVLNEVILEKRVTFIPNSPDSYEKVIWSHGTKYLVDFEIEYVELQSKRFPIIIFKDYSIDYEIPLENNHIEGQTWDDVVEDYIDNLKKEKIRYLQNNVIPLDLGKGLKGYAHISFEYEEGEFATGFASLRLDLPKDQESYTFYQSQIDEMVKAIEEVHKYLETYK